MGRPEEPAHPNGLLRVRRELKTTRVSVTGMKAMTAEEEEMKMTSGHAATAPGQEHVVVTRLSTRDRPLPIWIGAAMVGGLLLGRAVPGLNDALNAVKVGQTSLPIALGLLLIVYPVLAKVRATARCGRSPETAG